jgi:hypothetical protein
MIRSTSTRFFLIALAGVVSACGNASAPAAQTAPTAIAARAQATFPPASTVAPTRAAAASPPAATLAPTRAAAQPTAAVASAIPEGVTPEGYHYLGRPDAPATLVMYSDFL